MSTEQEQFDDLFKSKLEGSDFEFNEANWDKAEALIIAQDKKRKRRIIAFIFFIGLGLGICLMLPFINTQKNNLLTRNDTENNNTVNNNKIKKQSKEVTTVNEVNTNNQGISKEKTNTPTTSVKSEEKDQVKDIISLNTSQSNTKVETDRQEVTSKQQAITTIVQKTEKNSKTLVASHPTKENNSARTGKEKTQTGRGEVAENNNQAVSSKSNAASNNTPVKTDDVASTKEINQPKDNEPAVQKTDTAVVLPVINANTTTKDTLLTVKNSSTKTDSVIPVATQPTPNNNKQSLKETNLLSIDAGANYAFGWANSSIKEAAGFNAAFGLSFTHYFTKKWSVLAGVQYNSLAHLNYSNYTSNNTQYDFGYNQTKTIITPTILKYLAIPIKGQYYFNDKNSLSVGLNILYLINTNSKVETDVQSDFGSTPASYTTKAGYRDGFASFDLQPALAYRRKIYKAFSISAEVYYGLIDIKNNTAFSLNKAEHNSGLKLTLSYNIIHK